LTAADSQMIAILRPGRIGIEWHTTLLPRNSVYCIGIIDAKSLFGVESVKDDQNIDLVIKLEEFNKEQDYFTDTAFSHDQNAFSVNIYQHAVNRTSRCHIIVKALDQIRHKFIRSTLGT